MTYEETTALYGKAMHAADLMKTEEGASVIRAEIAAGHPMMVYGASVANIADVAQSHYDEAAAHFKQAIDLAENIWRRWSDRAQRATRGHAVTLGWIDGD